VADIGKGGYTNQSISNAIFLCDGISRSSFKTNPLLGIEMQCDGNFNHFRILSNLVQQGIL
jgi:hypothetical protein